MAVTFAAEAESIAGFNLRKDGKILTENGFGMVLATAMVFQWPARFRSKMRVAKLSTELAILSIGESGLIQFNCIKNQAPDKYVFGDASQ